MPRITVRDVPQTVHAVLKDRARRNRRSLNQEVVTILKEAADVNEADWRAAIVRSRISSRSNSLIASKIWNTILP